MKGVVQAVRAVSAVQQRVRQQMPQQMQRVQQKQPVQQMQKVQPVQQRVQQVLHFSPSPCGRGVGGGGDAMFAPLPQGEGELFKSKLAPTPSSAC